MCPADLPMLSDMAAGAEDTDQTALIGVFIRYVDVVHLTAVSIAALALHAAVELADRGADLRLLLTRTTECQGSAKFGLIARTKLARQLQTPAQGHGLAEAAPAYLLEV